MLSKWPFDSLKTNRLIGIIQPKIIIIILSRIIKITSFIETPDYRIVLNLEGIYRFTINEYNLSQNGYYVGDIDISNFEEDLNEIEPQIDRDNLLKKYSNFLKLKS